MAKLKLSGRKLCVTGRKLAVCGCGQTYQCCANEGNCRFVAGSTGYTWKVWANWQYTSSFRSNFFPYVGESYSGSCNVAYSSLSTANASQDQAGPCAVGGIAPQNRTTFSSSSACAIPANAIPDFPLIGSSATVGTRNLNAWPPSSSLVGGIGGGSGGSQPARFSAEVSLNWGGFRQASSPSYSGSGSLLVSFGADAGTLFVDLPAFTTGTATPSMILDGSCLVGFRLDFNLSTTNNNNGAISTATTSGYIVIVNCGKLVGCSGTGLDCSSSTPPSGSGSLIAALDSALFT